MPNYVNADTIPGHPLSGSGKQVPNHNMHPPHAHKFLSTDKSNWLNTNPVAASTNFYDIPGSIYCNTADKYGLVNVSGGAPVEFNLTVGHHDLQPAAWTGSAANGSIVFVYSHNG